jgi:ornithine cyclodeaminase/alanine dehydrogenase-like protein (mu-crystallin family)
MPLLLTEHDIQRVLAMPDLIEAMADALADYSAARVVQPVRTVLDIYCCRSGADARRSVCPGYAGGAWRLRRKGRCQQTA